jgi:DNA repair exonuclease SbcCD ATPase subunit
MAEQEKRPKIPTEVGKEAFEKLTEFEKSFFDEEEDGIYKLRVEGFIDNEELINAKHRETNKAKKLALELEEKEQQIKLLKKQIKKEEEKVDGNQSIYQSQIDELKKTLKDKEDKAKAKIEKATTERIASEISSLFISKKAGEAYARSRIAFEHQDDDIKVMFLDESGKPTSMTIEDFKKNIIDDNDLKPILKGIKSSGSNANGTTNSAVPTKAFKDMTLAERVALHKADPVAYQTLEAKSK